MKRPGPMLNRNLYDSKTELGAFYPQTQYEGLRLRLNVFTVEYVCHSVTFDAVVQEAGKTHGL